MVLEIGEVGGCEFLGDPVEGSSVDQLHGSPILIFIKKELLMSIL